MPSSYTYSSGSGPRRERARTPSASASQESEDWQHIRPGEGAFEDDIDPEESASRSHRTSSASRRFGEAPQPPSRRGSSRHSVPLEEPLPPRRPSTRRHTSSHLHHESHREFSDESVPSSTVESFDDYPASRHAQARAYQSGYRHVPPPPSHGGGYSNLNRRPSYGDPYLPHQALVQRGHPDPFTYGYSGGFNPTDAQAGHPFSPIGTNASTTYFAMDPLAPMPHHARPAGPARPASFVAQSHYPNEMITPYGHPAYPGYPMNGYPPQGWGAYGPPSQPNSPPPRERDERDDRVEELKKLKAAMLADENKEREAKKHAQLEASLKSLIQKHEEDRLAWEKEMIDRAKKEQEEKTLAAAKEAEEKRRKADIAEAAKRAKDEADAKAKDEAQKVKEEADKKLQEAEKAKEEAEKKHKELEEEAKRNKPPDDHLLAPIKFKDVIGRKFSFPYHLCKTWKGMDNLIKSAFAPIDMVSEHVHAGHFDLTGPDGEILLPQVWESSIKPDYEITMHMWPMPEQMGMGPPPGHGGLFHHPDDPIIVDDPNYDLLDRHNRHKRHNHHRAEGRPRDKGKGKSKGVPPVPPPPGIPNDPLAGLFTDIDLRDEREVKHKSSSRPKGKSSSKKVQPGLLTSIFGGTSAPRGSGKKR